MIYGTRVVQLGNEQSLSVGYSMCFSAPTLSMIVGRARSAPASGVEVVTTLSLSLAQLDALITTLQAIRAEMPAEGP